MSFEEDFDTDFEEKDSLPTLREEVNQLKKQVKYLKKMVVLNIFESKQDMKDFFSDIW